MRTVEKIAKFELYHIDRRTSLAPQLEKWIREFVLKHRNKPANIVWNPGTYRKAKDDESLEIDNTVPKGFVKMIVR